MERAIESCVKAYFESRNLFSVEARREVPIVYPEPEVFRISDKLKSVLDAVIPSDGIPMYWKFCACFSVFHSPRECEIHGMCKYTFERGFVNGVFDADAYISLDVGYEGAENLDISRYPMIVDPMISSFILELNRLGYATASSCSGHSWKNILDNGYYRLQDWQRRDPYYDGVSWNEIYFRISDDDRLFMNDLIRELNAQGIEGRVDGWLLRLNFWSEEEVSEDQIKICPSITNLTGLLKFARRTVYENLLIIAAGFASEDDSWVRSIISTSRPFKNRGVR